MDATSERPHGLVSQIVSDLMAGMSVQLLGVMGSGRSYTARQVTEELEFLGINSMWVHASRALAGRPMSALALSGVDVGSGQGSPETALARGLKSLESLIGQHNSVLIIDDADALDPTSIGLIATLRSRRDVPLLLIGAPGDWYKEPYVELLLAAQPSLTVRLREMTFSDITAMAQGILGGVVHTSAISKIAALSGGLPGLVQVIIRVGRRNGRFVFQDRMWNVEGELWDEALRAPLIPYLRHLEETEVESLSRLAVAGVVPQLQAETLLGRVKVEEYCRRGILQRNMILGEGDLTVYPPALAELLVRIRMETESVPERQEHADPEGPPSNLLVTSREAGILADRIITHWEEHIAELRDSWEEEKTFAAATPLVAAMLAGMPDEEEIAAIWEETEQDAEPAAKAHAASMMADYRALGQNDLDGALEDLKNASLDLPEYASHFRGHMAHLTLICSGQPDRDLLVPAEKGERGTDLLRLSRVEAMLARGMIDDALAELMSFVSVNERGAFVRQALIELAQVLSGRVLEGVQGAVAQLQAAITTLDPRAISCHAYVAALGMSMLGRFAELESVVEIVYRLAELNVFQSFYRVGLFSIGSFVADWEGRHEYAHSLALQARSLSVGSGPFPGMVAGLDLLFNAATSADDIWGKVDEFLDRGYVVSAVFLGIAASELAPAPTRAARLVEAGLRTQSEPLHALCQYIRATANGDLEAFPKVIAEVSRTCGPLDTTRARITWALLLRERGDNIGWVEQANLAWEEAGSIDRSCDGLFARLSSVVDLTGRETEVATSAAKGQASIKIAANLGVSSRTVEKHLQAVYRKTGALNRDELRQILKSWLTL